MRIFEIFLSTDDRKFLLVLAFKDNVPLCFMEKELVAGLLKVDS